MKYVAASLALLATVITASPLVAEDPNNPSCGKYALLFSRGTFEMGEFGIVGGPYVAAVQNIIPRKQIIYWGNEYDNSVFGYLSGGSSTGTESMKAKAAQLVAKCPGIKLIWSGYSQGAQVTHKALGTSSQAVKSATAAVVLFGDPLKGTAIPGISNSIINTDCDPGDQICSGLPLISAAHLAYGNDANRLAKWTTDTIGYQK